MADHVRGASPPAPHSCCGAAPLRLLAVATLSILAGAAALGQEVTLTGGNWTLAVEPQTLAVRGTLAGGRGLILSGPRAAPLQVEDLRAEDRHLSWQAAGREGRGRYAARRR